MKRRYKILLSIFTVILTIHLLIKYFNQTLIPVKLKNLIINTAEKNLRIDIDIESLRFNMARGFISSGVRIYDGPRENRELLFKAKNIYFGVLFLPSFKGRRFIIPRISIDRPEIRLERAPDGRWNLPPALFPKKDGIRKDLPVKIAVNSISFDNGKLLFIDRYRKKRFEKNLYGLTGSIGLSLPNAIGINCAGKVEDAYIKITSKVKLPGKNISVRLETKDLIFAEAFNAYMSGMYNSRIASGSASGSLKLDISNLKYIDSRIDLQVKGLSVDSKKISCRGNYSLTGNAAFKAGDIKTLEYNLKLKLDNAAVSMPIKSLKKIEGISGNVAMSEKEWSTKNLSCNIYNSQASINGKISAPHGDYAIELRISSPEVNLAQVAQLPGLNIKNGTAGINTRITYKKNRAYRISAKTDIKKLSLQEKDIIIDGDFLISGESSGTAGKWEDIKYKGSITFADTKIVSSGLLPLISGASGKAVFDSSHLAIKNLAGNIAGSSVSLNGNVGYKKKHTQISLRLKADDLLLTKLISALPAEIASRLKGADIKGRCSLDLEFEGEIKKPKTYRYKGKLSLKEASIALSRWPNNISGISGNVIFNKQDISWEGLYFDIAGRRYQSYGKLTSPATPLISLTLKSKDLDAIGEFKVVNEIINISKCKGTYLGSGFSIKGKVSGMKNPVTDISGNIDFNLKDAPELFKAHAGMLRNLRPEGIIKLNFDMKGPLKSIPDCTLFVEGGAKAVYLAGFKFDDFYLDYRMKGRFIDIPTIAAYPYGGIINITSRANLKTDERPYIVNIDIKGVDLHRLVKDTKFKDKKIKGLFTAQSVLNGYLGKKNSLKGNGWLQVSDGYLWEFPVMHGVLEAVFGLPPDYVILTDAFGNFSVDSKRLYTEDFKMLSRTASLLWVGSLGFNGALDFNITGRFAEGVMKKTTTPGRIAGAILREAGNLIMEIRLTGTLSKPKYQIVPFPVKRIFNESVVDRVKDIFGNVFE